MGFIIFHQGILTIVVLQIRFAQTLILCPKGLVVEETMDDTGYQGSLKGQFLMAMPGMVDPNFQQTVTCMCEHNSQGAMGLVVNRVQNALRQRIFLKS